MATVTHRIPASTSNCGPGFDSLGLALSLANEVTLHLEGPGDPIRNLQGSGAHAGENLAAEAAAEFFRTSGLPPQGFSFRVQGSVPPARGLGSSVTLLGGVVAGLNHLLGAGASRQDLAAMVSRIEGHPDNATASLLGGFCVARFCPKTRDLRGVLRREVPGDLVFVVVSPSQEMLTKESRGVLPQTLRHTDAVQNVNAASWLVAAIFAGDWPSLALATEDHLHQPFRLPRIRGAAEAIAAGLAAGAFGGWLSGSGSSVLCVSSEAKSPGVAAAMAGAFAAAGSPCECQQLRADNTGLRLSRDSG